MGLFDYQPNHDFLKWVLLNANDIFGNRKQTLCIENCWLVFREKDGALWAHEGKNPFLFLSEKDASDLTDNLGKEWSAKKCHVVFD